MVTNTESEDPDEILKKNWLKKGSVQVGKLIATGGYGRVYAGVYKGMKVAIKDYGVIYDKLDDEDKLDIMQEFQLMKDLNHTNTVRVYGFIIHQTCLALVMELATRGVLKDFIQMKSLRNNVALQYHILLQIAQAMRFIHSQDILHRDLKPDNVLVFQDESSPCVIKITDFGESRRISSSERSLTCGRGTFTYMDKLAFTKGNNKSTDFFSFCVLAAELLSGTFTPKITDVDSLLSRTSPDIPESVPKELRDCLLSGFNEDQKLRGDWSDVILALQNALDFTKKQGGFSVTNFIRIEIETHIHNHSKNDRFTSFNDISLENGFFQRRKKLLIPLLIGILLCAAAGITIPLVLSTNDDSTSVSSTTTLSTMSSLDTSISTMSSSTLSTTSVSTEPTTSTSYPSTSSVLPRKKGTLMIVGGALNETTPYQTYKYADIIDLENEASDCQSSKYPLEAYNIQGGLVFYNGVYQAIFCGGRTDEHNGIQNCYAYVDVLFGFRETAVLHSYAGIADCGSAVQVYNNSGVEQFLWITGGIGEEVDGIQKSVQLVSTNGNILDAPEMPESLSCHCAVAISDKAILVIGGLTSNGFSKMTRVYDFESKQWNNGTELSVARAYHACASFETDAIYVVGGWGPSNADATDSVEFSVINQDLVTVGEWTEDEGLKFPHGIDGHAMVSSQSSLYVIGGKMLVEGNYEISDSIFELNLDPHYNSVPRWTELPQKLKVPRQFVAAVILPAELDACQQVSSPKGTLMVVGGTGDTESIKFASTEIIDLNNEDSDCESFDYPWKARSILGGVLTNSGNTKVIFCGGFVTSGNGISVEEVKTCYEFGSSGFNETVMATLLYGTKYAASAVNIFNSSLNEQHLWIIGGLEDVNRNSRQSVQLVSMNGNVLEGPDMKGGISEHCVVALGDKGVMVIGGNANNSYQYDQTFLYNLETKTWNHGRKLSKGRKAHACTSFEKDGKFTVYVVGGTNYIGDQRFDSVEFAVIKEGPFGSLDWEWKPGPTFPYQIKNHAMVSSNSFVYVIGGEIEQIGTESTTSSSIYKLDASLEEEEDATWIEMKQKMKVARHSAAALILPEELSTCGRQHN